MSNTGLNTHYCVHVCMYSNKHIIDFNINLIKLYNIWSWIRHFLVSFIMITEGWKTSDYATAQMKLMLDLASVWAVNLLKCNMHQCMYFWTVLPQPTYYYKILHEMWSICTVLYCAVYTQPSKRTSSKLTKILSTQLSENCLHV